MRAIVVTTFVSLDGVMQAPGGPGEDDSGGFAYGGWSVKNWDALMGDVMGKMMGRAVLPLARPADLRHLLWVSGRMPGNEPGCQAAQ